MPKGALFCPACGQPVGLELEGEAFETDDELDRQPITVEPDRPHGLRNLLIAVGAVGLFVAGAVVVGRHDSKQPTASAGTTTTSSPRSQTTLPGASTSTTSTSTTIAPPATSAWIDLAPKGQLLPEPTGVVLYSTTTNGRLVRIDLDTGVVTVRSVDLADGVGSQYFVRGGKLVVAAPDSSRVFVLSRDLRSETQQLELPSGSQVLRGPAEDELWVIGSADGQREPNQVSAQRIHLDGTPVGPRLTLPGNVGDDGAGQLILFVPNAAATYALDTATGAPSRLLNGFPIALDHSRVVDMTCDDHLACHLRVTNRATGQARVLPDVATSKLVDYGGGGMISPDGRWLALLRDPGRMMVIDLQDGSERLFDDARLTAYWGQGPAWSPDGGWLFWTGGARVYAWRAGSASAQTVGGDDLPELVGLVAAPKGP